MIAGVVATEGACVGAGVAATTLIVKVLDFPVYLDLAVILAVPSATAVTVVEATFFAEAFAEALFTFTTPFLFEVNVMVSPLPFTAFTLNVFF